MVNVLKIAVPAILLLEKCPGFLNAALNANTLVVDRCQHLYSDCLSVRVEDADISEGAANVDSESTLFRLSVWHDGAVNGDDKKTTMARCVQGEGNRILSSLTRSDPHSIRAREPWPCATWQDIS
jgi:hypothetical protein